VDRCLLYYPQSERHTVRHSHCFRCFLFTVQVTDSSVPRRPAPPINALLVNPFFQFLGTQLQTASPVSPTAARCLSLVEHHPTHPRLPLEYFHRGWGLRIRHQRHYYAAGTYTLTFQATDSSVPPQSATVTLTLGRDDSPCNYHHHSAGGVLNSPYSATIATSGGLGTIFIAPTANTLPPGLAMDLHV